MLQKIWQPIFFIIIATIAVIWQWSFINALPAFFGHFNFILIVLIFILFFFDFRSAVFVAITSGFWLDVLGFNFFGLYLITVLTTVMVAEWLLAGWLTNRSLYSFVVLFLLSTLVYNLLASSLLNFSDPELSGLFLFRQSFWLSLGYQAAWNVIASLFLFNLVSNATHRLKPFFLSGK